MHKYSVLMSVYKKEKVQYLKETIESILNQTLQPDEFVIVEDGKLTDELESLIKQYEKKYKGLFRIIKLQNNVGLGKALSIGIKKCSNEYIARMDSDDIAKNKRCEIQLKMLEENPKLDVVGSIVAEFENNINNIIGYRNLPQENSEIYEFAKKRNPLAHPSVMLRKSRVLEVGNYRDCLYFEDYDLWIRMIEKNYKFYNIQEVLVYMRVEDSFYKRRGGINYLKRMIKFKTMQYNKGFYTLGEYIKTTLIHIIVCLMPNKIRKFIYVHFLRCKHIN